MRSFRFKPKLGILNAIAALGAILGTPAAAAPCCGGGSAIPSMITGDDRAQMGASVSQASVIGDAPAQGIPVFRSDNDSEISQTMRLDGAYRFADRFQAGAAIPVIRRERTVSASSAQATGLGDITLGLAYEALPEWSYSPWKPHGFLFVQSTLPTSPSTYDAQAPFQIDARGRGFFQLGAGAALLKGIGIWDFVLTAEGHRSFSRTFDVPGSGSLDLTPGWGATALVGAGVSPFSGPVRVGLSLSPVYEGPIRATGDIDSVSDSQLVWNTSVQAGYLISQEWSVSASYTDQTLVGPARNVSLSRSAALSAQKRWTL